MSSNLCQKYNPIYIYLETKGGEIASPFFFRKTNEKGETAPSIEVYIAGCFSGVPVILTKNIQLSPRRKAPRHAALDAIPEDEEVGKEHSKGCNGMIHHRRKLQIITDSEIEEYESEGKIGHHFYSDEMYTGEDGQLTWFNAGVRVGVGFGLGMCLGIGLLMRSYQATTSNFRRRFL